jgi:hypothetical protein
MSPSALGANMAETRDNSIHYATARPTWLKVFNAGAEPAILLGILPFSRAAGRASALWINDLPGILDHDATKWNRIMISSLCLSMIFSEKSVSTLR